MRESLKNLPARSLLLIGWSAVFLSILASLLYGVLPPWRAYQKMAALQDTLASYALSDIDLAAQIADRTRENEELKQQFLGGSARLPAKQLQTYVIGKLQAVCWETRMEMVSVKPIAESKLENLNASEFDIELAGDYFDWFAWLRKMRDELGFVTVQGYDIKALSLTEADPKLGFSLRIAAYRAAEEP